MTDTMTTIAYLVSEYPGKSHTFIRREVAELRARGLTVETISIRVPDPNDTSELDTQERARTHVVLGSKGKLLTEAMLAALSNPLGFARTLGLALRHRAPGAKAALWSLFHLAEALVVARMLKRTGARHLHSHFANSGSTVALLAGHFTGVPWSFTVHGISETDYPAGVMLGDKIRHADFVACASWFMRAQSMRVVEPSHWDKMAIVRCGIDLATLPPAPPRAPGPVRLICVGRLSSEKGHSGLLVALAKLVAAGRPVVLELVGDGPLGDMLRGEVAALGLGEHVHFIGRLDERSTLARIAAADVLVLPSLMEGLPVVLIEALALGKPVVSSWVAGVPELVEPGRTGLLFAPGDWARLAECLDRIVTDDALRAHLAVNARAPVEAEFAIDKAVAPLIERFAR